MENKKLHIVWILANNTSAPYFKWFAEYSKQKSEFKLSFICLYSEKPKMIEEMNLIGWECYWVKYDYNKRKLGLLKGVFSCLYLFIKIKPDIIHSHLFDDSLISMIAGKLAMIKKRYVTKGDTGFHYYYKSLWVFLDRLINHLATNIIAISNESRNFIIEKEGAKSSKVKLIHHGIPKYLFLNDDFRFKEEFINKYNLKDKIVIGTISRFIEWKGYKNIVDAAEIITKKYSNVIFVFIGQGNQKDEIIDLVRSKEIVEKVVFTDWIDSKYIPSVFKIMNIYLHAAKYEPFGLVIAEAMLNGVPVVSTKTGAALDAITHLQNGFLCNYNSINDLVDGITFLIENDNLQEIVESAKKQAENMFSIELMYQKHFILYNN